ncbi:MAG: tetratricopeptide repeat protein [Pseudomonadota bacterium]|nr:tetratricopeptide repeat protein [Pseudomonadota bacterium]
MTFTIDRLIRKAALLARKGEVEQSEKLYRLVLEKFPNNKRALSGLNSLVELSRRALPRGQLSSLASLYNQGKLKEALTQGEALAKMHPNSIDVLNFLGIVNSGLNKFDQAAEFFAKCVEINPLFAEGHNNHGNALCESGNYNAATECYKKALKIEPLYADAHYNLGVAFKTLERPNEAISCYKKTLRIDPSRSEAHNNLGNALEALGRYQEALECYRTALKEWPDDPFVHNNIGSVFTELGQLENAIDSCDRAIKLKPDYAEAYHNRGNAQKELGKLEDALVSFSEAIRLKPDYAEARWNLSLALLLNGNLKDGWREYEYGKQIKHTNRRVTRSRYKLWEGGSLKDKTILITAEQGVGDEVMFASCIPDLIRMAPNRIIVECDSRLTPLFERSFQQVETINRKERDEIDWISEIGNIDFQISVGSLPGLLRQSPGDFPTTKSYLLPNAALQGKWKNRFDGLGEGLKIGISWSGGGNEKLKKTRSIDLRHWGPILQSEAHFINLQYGDHSGSINKLEAQTGIRLHQWDDVNPLVKLDDFITQIGALDLVISIDNSTVHFAGAIGTEVWALLPFTPEFRWLLARNNSLWYPTMRLFRQKQHGDWASVLDEVSRSLKAFSINS